MLVRFFGMAFAISIPDDFVKICQPKTLRMNGQCLVESRPGYGVVILLTVPLWPRAADLGLT